MNEFFSHYIEKLSEYTKDNIISSNIDAPLHFERAFEFKFKSSPKISIIQGGRIEKSTLLLSTPNIQIPPFPDPIIFGLNEQSSSKISELLIPICKLIFHLQHLSNHLEYLRPVYRCKIIKL